MRVVRIIINTIDKAKDFSNMADKYTGSLDILSGRYTIDAKSILGIFSIDITKPVELRINGDDEKEITNFLESIDKYIIK